MVYIVEIRGQGFAPYEFATKQKAEDYAITMTVWSGGAYRISRVRRGYLATVAA